MDSFTLHYEESIPTNLQLTFFSALYLKNEATEDEAGPIRLKSLKTGRTLKLPFELTEEIVLKLPAAVDRANNSKSPKEDNITLFEEQFQVNEEYLIALQVTSYQERNWIFLKPKKKMSDGRLITQKGNVLFIFYSFSYIKGSKFNFHEPFSFRTRLKYIKNTISFLNIFDLVMIMFRVYRLFFLAGISFDKLEEFCNT